MKSVSLFKAINCNSFALFLILISNICFYNSQDVIIYRVLSIVGIGITMVANFSSFSMKVKSRSCVLWLVLIYLMYFVYGLLFLKAGEFNRDIMLFRFLEGVAISILINSLLQYDAASIIKPFVVAGLFSMTVLVIREGTNLIIGGLRIGETLSGNSNTVGFNFGLISLLTVWGYCIYRKKSYLVLFAILALFVLVTGSKKALIIIIFDFIMMIVYQKRDVGIWLKSGIGLAIILYLVFNVNYFYNIIGVRIESMFYTWTRGSSVPFYSYSTEMRAYMIREGFGYFLRHPVFGGGYNYFYANTSTAYDYSHCNYIELLCSFGSVGTLLYYSKHFSSFRRLIKEKTKQAGYNKDLKIIGIIMILLSLILDWGAVTFSAQVVWYIPIIISSIAVEQIYRNNTTKLEG